MKNPFSNSNKNYLSGDKKKQKEFSNKSNAFSNSKGSEKFKNSKNIFK